MKCAHINCQTSYKLLIKITSGTSPKVMFGESNWWINSKPKLLSAKTEKSVIPNIFLEIGRTFTISLSRLNLKMVFGFWLISNTQLSHKSLRIQLKTVLKSSSALRLAITSSLIRSAIRLWSVLFKTCQARLENLVQWPNTRWHASGVNKKLTTTWKKQSKSKPIQTLSRLP